MVKKWWFWLMLVIIVIIICMTMLFMKVFAIVEGEVENLSEDIHKAYRYANVYSSAEGDTLVIELRNWNTDYADTLNQIVSIIRQRIDEGQLDSFTKLRILTYLNSGDGQENIFISYTSSLPDFIPDNTQTRQYVSWEDYEDMYEMTY